MARNNTPKSFGWTSNASMTGDQLLDMVRKKAYELYEKRGKRPGHAMEDWLEAERIVRRRSF